MTLPAAIAGALEHACGSPVAQVRRASGGDINDAFDVLLACGRRVFVKTRSDAPAGEYVAEAAGLRWLGEPGGPRIPGVVAVGDDEGARYLALEWIEAGTFGPASEEQLGRGLAAVHASGAPAFGASAPGTPAAAGGPAANGAEPPPLRIGPLVLSNQPCADWPSFYVERRLQPLAARARRAGGLTLEARRDVDVVCARIDVLAGPPEPPARLHGDLWVGNVLADHDGRPYLIDPSAYGGHREVDLAMLRLFGVGAAIDRITAAYQEVSPLADGHERRVGLWQLFPLLVHAALFGGYYGASVQGTARRCLLR